MKKNIFVLVFIFNGINGNCQFLDYNNAIGINCGFSEYSTPLVIRTKKYLQKKNYNKISKYIRSKSSGKVLLGFILNEKLVEDKLILLSKKDEQLQESFKFSELTIESCSGCEVLGGQKIKDVLKDRDEGSLRWEIESWYEELK